MLRSVRVVKWKPSTVVVGYLESQNYSSSIFFFYPDRQAVKFNPICCIFSHDVRSKKVLVNFSSKVTPNPSHKHVQLKHTGGI